MLPSSINYQGTGIDKAKAKVKYHVKAVMHDMHDHAVMQYKQVLVIREQGDTFQVNIN